MYSSHAQYVALPDTNFGRWLSTFGYSACVTGSTSTGYQLDTTCSAVLTADTMRLHAQVFVITISNLWGIQFFKNLKYLDCSFEGIAQIPELPNSLKYLYQS
jgi:hypothetical protein